MRNTAVYVGTTHGPTQILKITKEDRDVPSLMCVAGGAKPLPVSTHYNNFVRRGSGVIAQHTGHESYCADLSHEINKGDSWGLGLYLAHALHSQSALASNVCDSSSVIWASGSVERGLQEGVQKVVAISAIDDLAEKLDKSAALFGSCVEKRIPVTIVLPKENVSPAIQEQIKRVCPAASLVCLPSEIEAVNLWTKFQQEKHEGFRKVLGSSRFQYTAFILAIISGIGVAAKLAIDNGVSIAKPRTQTETTPDTMDNLLKTDATKIKGTLGEVVFEVDIDYTSTPSQSCYDTPLILRKTYTTADFNKASRAYQICGGGEIAIQNKGDSVVSLSLLLTSADKRIAPAWSDRDKTAIIVQPSASGQLRWGRRQPVGAEIALQIEDSHNQQVTIPIINSSN